MAWAARAEQRKDAGKPNIRRYWADRGRRDATVRTGERRVFAGATPLALHKVIVRACERAGIPRFHPHDLRHRYASVQIARGVPVTNLAAQLGHARSSITLDTYSHVLLNEA